LFALVDEALSHHKLGNEGGNCFEAIKREVMKSTRRSLFWEWKGLLHQKELRKWGY
jgi:hypothetical protein